MLLGFFGVIVLGNIGVVGASLAASFAVLVGGLPRIRGGRRGGLPSGMFTWVLCSDDRGFCDVSAAVKGGAKKRVEAAIEDRSGLPGWFGVDRASVKLRDAADVAAKREAFTDVLGRWIAALPSLHASSRYALYCQGHRRGL